MSEKKHTPGPWETHFGNGTITTPDKDTTFDIGPKGKGTYAATRAANARLIARAPETAAERDRLLEVLRELVDLMDAVKDGEYDPDSFTTMPARAAIAEAEKE